MWSWNARPAGNSRSSEDPGRSSVECVDPTFGRLDQTLRPGRPVVMDRPVGACGARGAAADRSSKQVPSNGAADFSPAFASPRAQRRSRIRGRRILYVDDERSMRIAVARLLRGAGAVCLGTDSHDRAVALLALEPVLDLAILDLQMPDGDVGRLVRRLHWKRPGAASGGNERVGSARRFRPEEYRPLPTEALEPRRTDPRCGWVGSAGQPGPALLSVGRSRGAEPRPPAARASRESTPSPHDLPASGDTRALPARRRVASGRSSGDAARPPRRKRAEPMTVFVREPPWSLLRAQWLDVPIGADDDDSSPTWAVFSEAFERCSVVARGARSDERTDPPGNGRRTSR